MSEAGAEGLVAELRSAIRRATADEVNGRPNGDIIVKGCEAAEYVHPEDAAASFVDCIVDEIRPIIEANARALAEAGGPNAWDTNHEGYRSIFNAALTGICANPNFFSSLFQQSPEAAVEFANECVLAAIRSNGGRS